MRAGKDPENLIYMNSFIVFDQLNKKFHKIYISYIKCRERPCNNSLQFFLKEIFHRVWLPLQNFCCSILSIKVLRLDKNIGEIKKAPRQKNKK